MFKLGRKQLLGLLTAATVVVTTVGTFAVWDTLTATKTGGTLTLDKPVTVSVDEATGTAYTVATDTLNENNADASVGTITFKTENAPSGAVLTVTPTVKKGDADLTPAEKEKLKVDVKKGAKTLTNGVDDSVEAENVYTIEITPLDNATFKPTDVLTVDVTGELSKP